MRMRFLTSVSMLACIGITGEAIAAESAETNPRDDIIVTGLAIDDGLNQTRGGGALGGKKLLDTPFSVTVVDSEDIAKRQATTIAQIFVNDPSVFSFSTAGTTNWWGTQIRGLGVRNYYIDDVPLLLYWGGDYPLEPIESVEALKGLSGFMYGFGAPGGVISYKTKRPTAEPLLSTEVGYRTNSIFFAHIDAGSPLTRDRALGYRLNVAGEKGEAYNAAGVNRWLASLALDYAISPDLQWHATVTYEKSNLKHEPFQIYWDSYTDAKLPKPTYDYDDINIDNSFYRTRTLTAATGLDWTISSAWKADLTYGYTRKLHNSNKMFVNLLNEAGDYEGNAYNFAELDQVHFVQAMLQGKFDTGPIGHEIVLGASYQAYLSDFGLDGYYWNNDFNGNIYQRQTFRVTRDIDFSTSGSPSEEQQRAAFISDTLHLGDKWQAIVGARYTRYKLLDLDGDPNVQSGYRTSAVTPTFALIYKPADYISIYGSYVESMESGGRVGGEYANVGEVLGATISKQYEVGLKYQHRGASLTVAGFRVERANQIDQIVDGLRYLTQDGLTVYKGLEAIGGYRVNDNLKIGLGAVYLDPTITDVSEGNEAIRGNRPAEASKWQVVGNAEYAIPGIDGLSVHGNVRYFDDAYTSDYDQLVIPSRTLANMGFMYVTKVGERAVNITGNVNNIFNKKYWGLGNIGEGVNGSLSVKIYW